MDCAGLLTIIAGQSKRSQTRSRAFMIWNQSFLLFSCEEWMRARCVDRGRRHDHPSCSTRPTWRHAQRPAPVRQGARCGERRRSIRQGLRTQVCSSFPHSPSKDGRLSTPCGGGRCRCAATTDEGDRAKRDGFVRSTQCFANSLNANPRSNDELRRPGEAVALRATPLIRRASPATFSREGRRGVDRISACRKRRTLAPCASVVSLCAPLPCARPQREVGEA